MANVSVMQLLSGRWDSIQVAPAGGDVLGFAPTTTTPQVVPGLSFDAAGNLTTTGVLATSNFMEFTNMTAPSAPAATKARLYAANNGGKVTLYALFPTGAAVVVAAEP